ncbi:MAG TPA: aldo/keto reductase [Patescibacteria group bacterium]|nr:aldo/keto reductase [Patescibacteria group bacterium]
MKISRKKFLRSLLGMAGAGIGLRHAPAAGRNLEKNALRNLGKTGLQVTPLAMGASRTMEPALVQAALGRGIRFIDTGRAYANGKNEMMIGNVLKGKRQQIVIQSKVKLPEGFASKTGTKEALAHLEMKLHESLQALQTDHVDVLLLHGIQEEWILEDQVVREFFSRAKTTGKIRACGFSTHKNHLALLEKALAAGFFDVVMLPFNPFARFKHSISGWSASWDQDSLIKAMQRAHDAGIGIVAMKTCSGGPYGGGQGDTPSMAGAVQWVTDKPYIACAAVAMANFSQLEEHATRFGI